MNIEIQVKSLVMNNGQIAGLPKNPRQWTADDVERLARSIDETPELLDARPLIVIQLDAKYVVLGGNLRLAAIKKLKWEKAPCYLLPMDTPAEKLKEIVIKDNGSFGQWDYDELANSWDDFPLTDWGITAWPQENEAQRQMKNGGGAAGGDVASAQDDDFDEDDKGILVRCKQGDIWELGDHRLMCGDSTDLETVKKLMGGGEIKADMVFTDPPYGVAIGDKNAMLNSVQPSGRCCENIKNDTLSVPELYKVLTKAMTNVRENCKDDASYYVAAPPGGDFGLMMMMMQDSGLRVRHQIVWNKDSATFSLGRLDYDYKHEAIMYTWTKSHHNYRGGKFRTSVWDIPKPRKCDLHPTMKPIELVANCILDGTKEGDVILDSFGGSGTTMIAAEQLGRKCYMMELDPRYCDVIIARWEKFTGRIAKKIT